MSSASSSGRIPDDLLVIVLVRVPAKTLLRFKCVSRSWKTLIESKYFTNLHLKSLKTTEEENPKILLRTDEGLSWGNRPSLYVVELGNFNQMMRTTKMLAHIPINSSLCRIHGCCNGLVCLSDSYTHVFLWNPTIHMHWEIPVPDKFDPGISPGKIQISKYMYGFGYDDGVDDYKVVRVVEYFFPNFPFQSLFNQEVQVYSLKSNSWMRFPRFPDYTKKGQESTDGKLVNGAFHWILDNDCVLALDLKTETNKIVPILPNEILPLPPGNATLGVLDDCLCLSYVHDYPASLSLWILKDSWIKTVVLQPCLNFEPKSFRKLILTSYSGKSRDEIFLHDERFVYCYDVNENSARKYCPLDSRSLKRKHGLVHVQSARNSTTTTTQSAWCIKRSEYPFMRSLVEPWSCHY